MKWMRTGADAVELVLATQAAPPSLGILTLLLRAWISILSANPSDWPWDHTTPYGEIVHSIGVGSAGHGRNRDAQMDRSCCHVRIKVSIGGLTILDEGQCGWGLTPMLDVNQGRET